jgi:serine protease Do
MPIHVPRWAALALILAVNAPPMAALGQPQLPEGVPSSRSQITLSFAPVVKKVAPAVVNIYTRKVESRRTGNALFDDPVWRRFFSDGPDGGAPTRQRVRTSLGSGVLVDEDGIIVTNVHVVKEADEIRVVLADRREFDARVVLTDPRTDLALLKVRAGNEKLPFVEFHDSDALEVGDLVLAIGNPFGVGQTVTSGIVSALARTTVGVTDYRFFIQTDAAINPGNSGGALVTMDGRLAGINTAIYSRSGGSIGIGFAVPSAMVKAVVAGHAAGGRVVRPWLGSGGQRMTPVLAANKGMTLPRGVLIDRVHPDGPAAAAGLRIGDVVTRVNSLDVDDDQALRFRFATFAVGGTARLSVLRDGQEIELPVQLVAAPEVPPRDALRIGGKGPLSGATVANLSPAVAELVGLRDDSRGVVIMAVEPNTMAYRTRLQRGDGIRGVNGESITTTAELRAFLNATDDGARWRITILRKGRTVTITTGGFPG